MAGEHTLVAGDDTFDDLVLNSDLPVLVDFWAAWCGPCRAIAPHVDQMATELQGKVRVVKLDAQNHMKTAGRFGVSALPTFIVFKNGKEVERKIGTAGGGQALRKLVGF